MRSLKNSAFAQKGHLENAGDLDEAVSTFKQLFLSQNDYNALLSDLGSFTAETLSDKLFDIAMEVYHKREKDFGIIKDTNTPLMRELEGNPSPCS